MAYSKPKLTCKLAGGFISVLLSLGQVAYAVPWSETTSTIYTTDTNKSVGIGTTSPSYELHAASSQSTADPYFFGSYSTTTGERDIFTIRDYDVASSTQDESSVLKVMKSQTINNGADAFTLLELTQSTALPTVADRHFYILGRGGNDEGPVAWGVSLTDADFWTQGSVRGGAIGTNCGGTSTVCFSNPTFQLSASGNSYINGGNVGIGTSSPGAKLSVVAGSDTWAGSFFGLDTANQVRLGTYGGVATVGANNSTGSAWANLALNPGGGNVGIGTTTPGAKLEVVDGGVLVNEGTSGNPYVKLIGDSANEGLNVWYENNTGHSYIDNIYPNGSLYLRTNNGATNGITLLNTGDVGIGTVAPSAQLQVAGGDILLDTNSKLSFGGWGNGTQLWDDTSATRLVTKGGELAVVNQANSLNIATFNQTEAYIAGNVGIGTTSPIEKLDVSGNIHASGTICDSVGCIGSSSSSSGLTGSGSVSYISKWTSATSLGNSLIYDNGINVGIGDTTPDYRLDVNVGGNVGWAIYANSNTITDEYGAIFAEVDGNPDIAAGEDYGDVYAIWGTTNSEATTRGSAVGVRGDATASTIDQSDIDGDGDLDGGATFGVAGFNWRNSSSPNGSSPAGVWGGAWGNANVEYSGLGNGVQGETQSTHASSAGGRFYALADSGTADGVYGQTDSINVGSYGVLSAGPFGVSGRKSAIVYTESQGPTELYTIESPEIWFEDIGHGQLINGRVTIGLDSLFLETVTINDQYPMAVFIQSYDNVSIFVKPGIKSFEVIAKDNQNSNAKFSYRVLAKRKYYENWRLAPTLVTIDQFMRPDLNKEKIQLLNEQLGLPYEDLDNRILPTPPKESVEPNEE